MAETKPKAPVHKRKRVPSLSPEKRREIVALFDITDDYDYVAERCLVQRADVLAVVLADTRKRGPAPGPGLANLIRFPVRGAA